MTENPAQGAAPENRGQYGPAPEPTQEPAGELPEEARLPEEAPTQQTAVQQSAVQQSAVGEPAGTEPAAAFQPVQPATPVQHPVPEFSPPPFSGPDYGAPQRPNYPQHQPFYGGPQGTPQTQGMPQQQFPHAPHHSAAVTTKRKPAFGVGTLVASILAAGLIGGGVAATSGLLLGERTPAAVSGSQPGTVIVNNTDDVNVITAAAAKASPSVVTIKASSGNEGGTGSGIIIDDKGHILTNTHVVTLDGKTAKASVEVRTNDGRILKASVVGTDPLSDLAVIKVDDASGLVPATLGDSDKINVGDTAVAIGSPLGLTGTVTDGIVSTLNRTISVASSAAPKDGTDDTQGGDQGFQFAPPGGGQSQSSANEGSISINVIQTDAAINPGNSGGALVNSKGEIIGVNVAIASAGSDTSDSSSGNIGVGFSIPINHAKRVAQEIIDSGKASHGQFGVSVRSKSATGSTSGFSVGAEVASVTSGSAAAKAGIKVGDVVTKFGTHAVSDPNQLTAAVREERAGATVKVTIVRNGQSQEIDVTLDAAAQ
ncbi:S1C family serine protease [Arthrobacter cavernae]|uniref:Trypsin-like peptidase domain-containing protein n=1 Tax=Arthrobacter cavernae TaxID=2817681 RepID=A0A939HEC0_9MICC|nr:trypsin-like peptidase domain-containing protein [Arthrobacter cavernae]MBO1266800.1 trypsin-like peptidase domain-containing protein [Arthrobacter cavernae]